MPGAASAPRRCGSLQEGVASFEEVDRILRDAAGFRMGPFELMDLTGARRLASGYGIDLRPVLPGAALPAVLSAATALRRGPARAQGRTRLLRVSRWQACAAGGAAGGAGKARPGRDRGRGSVVADRTAQAGRERRMAAGHERQARRERAVPCRAAGRGRDDRRAECRAGPAPDGCGRHAVRPCAPAQPHDDAADGARIPRFGAGAARRRRHAASRACATARASLPSASWR